jgi:hypothetical protein
LLQTVASKRDYRIWPAILRQKHFSPRRGLRILLA